MKNNCVPSSSPCCPHKVMAKAQRKFTVGVLKASFKYSIKENLISNEPKKSFKIIKNALIIF